MNNWKYVLIMLVMILSLAILLVLIDSLQKQTEYIDTGNIKLSAKDYKKCSVFYNLDYLEKVNELN